MPPYPYRLVLSWSALLPLLCKQPTQFVIPASYIALRPGIFQSHWPRKLASLPHGCPHLSESGV
ncbi:hypothetical protein HC62_08745 [Acetobacter tropicalis]|uniref:Uncharacterized protein n=1 Tax=Acetobacter tropicalis TaxID=104102 RepID=A0A252A899_9PROT|nr:hypothetical protein HC62_08745 [Acetobacter tropicalis]